MHTDKRKGENMAYKILDISKYQNKVDYAKAAKAVDGVILRAGLTYWGSQTQAADSMFETHYTGFKNQGCPVGVYFYSAADSVALAYKEADFLTELLKDRQLELPVFYDVENNERQGSLSKSALTAIVDAFCSKMEKAGYYVGFYASTSWLETKLDTDFLAKKYTLWKADYRFLYDKKIACGMHQYTSQGKVSGISGSVDLSRCYVDYTKAIKQNGLNGFAKPAVFKTFTVKATKGDIDSFVAKAKELEITDYTVA